MLKGVGKFLQLHLLHIKRGLKFEDAIHQPNGIAVVAIWFMVGEDATALDPLISHVKDELYSKSRAIASENHFR